MVNEKKKSRDGRQVLRQHSVASSHNFTRTDLHMAVPPDALPGFLHRRKFIGTSDDIRVFDVTHHTHTLIDALRILEYPRDPGKISFS